MGNEMAHHVNAIFQREAAHPCYVELEMEKFFNPLVLYKKKRYAGLCFESADDEGHMCAKGIEMIRRDASPLLRQTQKSVLDALVVHGDPDMAVARLEDALEYVLAVPVGGPFACLAESKNLSAKYVNPDSMAHVAVQTLMNKRNPGSGPRVGERVSFVVIASETPRVVDKVDGVAFAEEHKLPPDWLYYVEKLEQPLMRLLSEPLETLSSGAASERVKALFASAKERALSLVRAHSLARHGVSWLSGHKCAKGGGTQLKLRMAEGVHVSAPKRARGSGGSSSSSSSKVRTIDAWIRVSSTQEQPAIGGATP
jgi:DNA polymerase elongation subunit (family B)